MNNKKLKLGILLDSYEVPAWAASIVKRIVYGKVAEFVLVILNGNSECNLSVGPFIYSFYSTMDKKLFAKQPDPFSPLDISGLIADIPCITVKPKYINGIKMLCEEDVEQINKYDLDILVKFGFESLNCKILAVSKYGTWFYHHGDYPRIAGAPAGLWEVVENLPETGSVLWAEGGTSPIDAALYRSYFFTYPLSPARHRSYYYWATASFLPRQVELLQRVGRESFLRHIERYKVDNLSKPKEYRLPSNIAAVNIILKMLFRQLKEYLKRTFYFDHWILMFSLKKEPGFQFETFHKLIPPRNKFWADPHILYINRSYYIFIEEFDHKVNRGHLSVIKMDEHGNIGEAVEILKRDYHLSYPHVFEWGGKFYMIPESNANRTIDLYECIEFPYQWIFKKNLFSNIHAVDTTLVYFEQKWWMFTAIAENEAAAPNVELFLFYTNDLFNNVWVSHPLNPIVSDVKYARPAGSIFQKDGKLFRPSQDCSRAYGYGFDLNEIIVLTETEYHERKLISVRPTWDKRILATHTYANQGELTVIDAFTRKHKIF